MHFETPRGKGCYPFLSTMLERAKKNPSLQLIVHFVPKIYIERATNFVDFSYWQDKVEFWPMDEPVHHPWQYLFIHKKYHPKSYHSDIEYQMTLDIVLSESYLSYILRNGQCMHLGFYSFLQKYLAGRKLLLFKYFNGAPKPLKGLTFEYETTCFNSFGNITLHIFFVTFHATT